MSHSLRTILPKTYVILDQLNDVGLKYEWIGGYRKGLPYDLPSVVVILSEKNIFIHADSVNVVPQWDDRLSLILAHELGHILLDQAGARKEIADAWTIVDNFAQLLNEPLRPIIAKLLIREEATAWRIGRELLVDLGICIDKKVATDLQKRALKTYARGSCRSLRKGFYY